MDEDELLKLLTGEHTAPIRVCRIQDRVARAIGANGTSVRLSLDTTNKQETKRSPADFPLYRRAPIIIARGFVLIEPPYHAIFIYHENTDKRRSFKAVVKVTQDGRELYLVSIHRIGRSAVRAVFRKAIRLTEWERGRREVGPPKNPT